MLCVALLTQPTLSFAQPPQGAETGVSVIRSGGSPIANIATGVVGLAGAIGAVGVGAAAQQFDVIFVFESAAETAAGAVGSDDQTGHGHGSGHGD